MAERKSGPVKPPVIDLQARESAAADTPKSDGSSRGTSGAAETAGATGAGTGAGRTASGGGVGAGPGRTEAPRQAPASPPRPPARLAMPWSAITIAAVGGAVLGTALTYGLVTLLPLPNQTAPIADPAARLSALEAQDEDLLARLGTLDGQQNDITARLESLAGRIDETASGLEARIADLPPPADLGAIETQLAALEDRVAVLGSGVSSTEASELAGTISGLEQSFAQLQASLETLNTQSSADQSALGTLQQDLAALRSDLEARPEPTTSPTDLGPAVRLPLVVSGLETAFATGRAYQSELSGLATLVPDLDVPQGIAAAASEGLPRPDAVAARFDAAVPRMLAARGNSASGDLAQDAMEWMKGILAVRPAQELEGDTPDAVLSRLESAVERRDFGRAETLLEALPESMRAAAGSVGDDIATLAAAEAFTATLRGLVLNPAAAEENS